MAWVTAVGDLMAPALQVFGFITILTLSTNWLIVYPTGPFWTRSTTNGMRWTEYGLIYVNYSRRLLFVSNETIERRNQEQIVGFHENL